MPGHANWSGVDKTCKLPSVKIVQRRDGDAKAGAKVSRALGMAGKNGNSGSGRNESADNGLGCATGSQNGNRLALYCKPLLQRTHCPDDISVVANELLPRNEDGIDCADTCCCRCKPVKVGKDGNFVGQGDTVTTDCPGKASGAGMDPIAQKRRKGLGRDFNRDIDPVESKVGKGSVV
jgi:hypothetical protein